MPTLHVAGVIKIKTLPGVRYHILKADILNFKKKNLLSLTN